MPRRAAATAVSAPVIEQTIKMPAASPAPAANGAEEREHDVFVYMRTLPQKEWENHIGYLYRIEPSSALPGLGGYLKKFTYPIDIEEIKAVYGGRRFKIMLQRGGELIYKQEFIIEAPPKLDSQREAAAPAAVNTDANAVAQQVLGLFREELNRRIAAEGSDPTNGKVVEMMSAASDRAMEMITRQIPQAANPTTQMREMFALAREMGLGGGSSSVLETVKVLKELGVIGGAPTNPAAQLESMLSIFSKLDDLRGSGGGRRSNGIDWGGIVEKGLELLPGILQARANDPRMVVAPRPGMGYAPPPADAVTPRAAAAPAAVAANPAPSEPLRVVPLRQAGPVTPAAAVPEGEGQSPAQSPMQAGPQFSDAQRDAWMRSRIVEYVALGYNGGPIIEFLGSLDRDDIIRDVGSYPPETVTAFFANDEILKTCVQHPRWTALLAEAQAAAREFLADEATPPAPAEADATPPVN
jgi:hypothetical protein